MFLASQMTVSMFHCPFGISKDAHTGRESTASARERVTTAAILLFVSAQAVAGACSKKMIGLPLDLLVPTAKTRSIFDISVNYPFDTHNRRLSWLTKG